MRGLAVSVSSNKDLTNVLCVVDARSSNVALLICNCELIDLESPGEEGSHGSNHLWRFETTVEASERILGALDAAEIPVPGTRHHACGKGSGVPR